MEKKDAETPAPDAVIVAAAAVAVVDDDSHYYVVDIEAQELVLEAQL